MTATVTQPARLFALTLAASVLACGCLQDLDLGSSLEASDAGATDSGATDSGATDAGTGDTETPDLFELPQLDYLVGVTSVDIGQGHACAVTADGELYCWGENEYGELGLGDGVERFTATRVGTDSDWAFVELSSSASCAVKTDGSLWCWGRNHLGQLGDGSVADRTVPTPVAFPGQVVQLDSTGSHCCARNELSELWCWGNNRESNLGQGFNAQSGEAFLTEPTQVTVDGGTGWRDVAVGDGHTCGIKADGVLMCWGRNTQGMAGGPAGVDQVLNPSPVVPPDGVTEWLEVKASWFNTCVKGDDDQWYCVGSAGSGRLPGVERDAFVPTAIATATAGTIEISAFHLCHLDEADELTCWGLNLDGLLADDGIGETFEPIAVGETLGPIDQMAVGRFNTCVVVSGGTLFCRGENGGGTVGGGAPRGDSPRFVQVGEPL
jgi:alpha-tubulin suppressor-like RCC1 family protein